MWQTQAHLQPQLHHQQPHPQQQHPIVVSPTTYHSNNAQTPNGIHNTNGTYNGPNGSATQSPSTPNGNQHTWFSDTTFMSGILTNTTPTLTPTTLASIEQSFIELQSVPVTTASNAVHSAADLSQHQAGFVPPVINTTTAAGATTNTNMPIKTEYDMYSTDDSNTNDDWMPTVAKRSRPDASQTPSTVINYGQPGSSAPATGAPQRKTPGRKGKNEVLTPGEEKKRHMRRERNKLAAAKCRQRRVDHTNELLGETEDLEETRAKLESEVQQLQQQKEQLEFLLEAHKPLCGVPKLIVKPDPDSVNSTTTGCTATCTTMCSTTTSAAVQSYANNTQILQSTVRPNTLPLTVQNMEAPISTPSNVYNQLGLDALMEGHSTGLTPITGVPSCAREAKRNSSDSSPSDNGLASPTRLMAL